MPSVPPGVAWGLVGGDAAGVIDMVEKKAT